MDWPSSQDSERISSDNARLLCEAARALGGDPVFMLSQVELPTAILDGANVAIPYEAAKALWEVARESTGDEFFGLHTAETLQPHHFGAMGYAVRSSLRGTDAMERVVRYTHCYFHDVELSIDPHGHETHFTQRFRSGRAGESGQASDFILATFVLLSREFTNTDWAPNSVNLQHKAPSRIDEYRRIFRCPVSFGDARNLVAFDSNLMELRLRGANPELLSVLEKHVDAYLERLPRPTDFTSQVRQAVADGVQVSRFGLEATAFALHVSPRTVQRKLRAENTSHREILDGVRQELAQRYLREPSLSVDQVSMFLGFSEPSAFHRAYRRWTGTTPAAYRATVQESGGVPDETA